MDDSNALGFLHVLQLPDIGFCGGLLVLDTTGRPREFHCSMPIAPTRTQQVLYGGALRGALVGQHVAPALLEKAKDPLRVLLTCDTDVWNSNRHVTVPMGHILSPEADMTDRCQGVSTIDGQRIAWNGAAAPHVSCVEVVLTEFCRLLPLTEPFQRIHDAIEEAQSAMRQERRAS